MRNSEGGLEDRLAAWAGASGCRLCVLFGSRAGAGPGVDRDVDLALRFASLPSPERRLQLIGGAQDACGKSRADVVFLHLRTDPVLRFEIFRSGVPLFEADVGLFIEEKVRALMLYEDALPFRRMLRERLREDSRVT